MADLPNDNVGTGEVALITPKKPRAPYGLHSKRKQMTTGIRSYSLGMWPPGSGRIVKEAREAQAELERLVADRNGGEVSVYQAGVINTAMKYFIWSRLLQKYVNKKLRGERETDLAIKKKIEAGRASAEARGCDVSGAAEPPIRPEKPLTMMELVGMSDRITKYLEQRDNCVRRLKLDQTEVENVWAGLYDDPKETAGDAGDGGS